MTGLAVFFGLGAAIAATSAVSLLWPGSLLEPMWRLNPRAHEGLTRLGAASVVLLACVAALCGLAAIGLWRGPRWGYRLALFLLVVNLVGDVANVISGTEPLAAIGIPIVAVLVSYLAKSRVRRFFVP